MEREIKRRFGVNAIISLLRLMMALTPKRLFLSLSISISLLRSYTFFSRSPLVSKTLFAIAYPPRCRWGLLAIVYCLLAIVYRLLAIVYRLLAIVYRLLATVYRLPLTLLLLLPLACWITISAYPLACYCLPLTRAACRCCPCSCTHAYC